MKSISVSRVQLGDIAVDRITGMKGVVVCVSEWLHGCRRISIQPQECQADGKPKECHTFDEPQIQVLKARAFGSTADTGGPRPEPSKAKVP